MTIDTQIIPKSISDAAVETFKVMAQDTATVESVAAESSKLSVDAGIISLLSLNSDQFSGTLAIYFPATTYVPLMNKILGENQTEICPGNSDGASEFLNIIYASARTKINESGFNFQPAIPSTLKGQHLELPSGAKTKVLKIHCRSGFGPFTVALCLTAR